MTHEQYAVKRWMKDFGQECPERPTVPSLETRILRAKLHLEEDLETTIYGLGLNAYMNIDGHRFSLWELLHFLKSDKLEFVEHEQPNLVEIADGCEDLKVVTDGTLVACGLIDRRMNETCYDSSHGGGHYPVMSSIDPLFNEVMRSNNSKMWTHDEVIAGKTGLTYIAIKPEFEKNERCWLVKDKDGKVAKPTSYSPANLQPIIDEMSK